MSTLMPLSRAALTLLLSYSFLYLIYIFTKYHSNEEEKEEENIILCTVDIFGYYCKVAHIESEEDETRF